MKNGKLIANESASAPAMSKGTEDEHSHYKHRILERKPILFSVLVFVAILIGGLIEYVPLALVKDNIPRISGVKPYTPLELEGRDIYIREGCNTCHSQMIRPFRSETERYGEYSKAGEGVFEHPFLWGSKRTGPDLAREGVKEPAQGRFWRTNAWHYDHLVDPRKVSPGSIMPAYPWLAANALDTSSTEKKIRALTKIGVEYPEGYDKQALADLQDQAAKVAKCTGAEAKADSEMIAMIAYLQRLGTDIKGQQSYAAICD